MVRLAAAVQLILYLLPISQGCFQLSRAFSTAKSSYNVDNCNIGYTSTNTSDLVYLSTTTYKPLSDADCFMKSSNPSTEFPDFIRFGKRLLNFYKEVKIKEIIRRKRLQMIKLNDFDSLNSSNGMILCNTNTPLYRFEASKALRQHRAAMQNDNYILLRGGTAKKLSGAVESVPVRFGVPIKLLPYYVSFLFDSMATGLALPLLPFFVMELGATALQISMIVSLTYLAQMIGCLVMGPVSDRYGRRPVLLLCLLASCLSYTAVSHSHSVYQVLFARLISSSLGGLVPVMQSCVADTCSEEDRPKFIGRITATFGLGFVLGPLLSAALPRLATRRKILLAASLPLLGFAMAAVFSRETKRDVASPWGANKKKIYQQSIDGQPKRDSESSLTAPSTASSASAATVCKEVKLLVLSGFLAMFSFSTESIYAVFAKESFDFGERALSLLLAGTGLFVGCFQVSFIRPLIALLGKHATLTFGNLILTIGMLGIGIVRKPLAVHVVMFVAHILGFAIADTALASLIIRYSDPRTQGRDLALNQAAQACARILSPLAAGYLYGRSKEGVGLFPSGSLPFLVGAISSSLASTIPLLLNLVSKKKSSNSDKEDRKKQGD